MATELVNKKIGIENLGSEEMFNQCIKKFEDEQLDSFIKNGGLYYASSDWAQFKGLAHKLKASSGYVGALQCQNIASEFQTLFLKEPNNNTALEAKGKELLSHAEQLKSFLSPLTSKKFLVDNSEFQLKSEDDIIQPVQISRESRVYPEPVAKGQEDEVAPMDRSPSISKRLIPPLLTPPEDFSNSPYERDELDPFEEISRHWRCTVL